MSFYAGFALALPVVLWQTWSFLAPAFQEHSQRIVAVFVAIATALFAGGLAFAYFIVLPRALHFLTTYNEEFFEIEIRANYYFSFVTLGLIGFALVFQLPIFVLALVRLGVLTSETLRSNRRIGYVSVLLVAILLPDGRPDLARLRGGPAPRALRSLDLGLGLPRETLGGPDRGAARGVRRRHRHAR